MAEHDTADSAAAAFLIRHAGLPRLTLLLAMMFAASLSEGVGLVLLVPITQLVADSGAGNANWPDWLDALADWPLSLLLAAVVGLVTLRALLVFLTSEERRKLGLELSRELRGMIHGAILSAQWRWLSRQNSADHAALIMGEADRVSGLANQALSLITATVTLIVLIASAALISWQITLSVVAIAVLASLLLVALRRGAAREGAAYFAGYTAMQRLVSNGLQHLRAARIAHAEEQLSRSFSGASERLAEVEGRFFRASHRNAMVLQVVAVILLAMMVYLALDVFDLPVAIFLPILAIMARLVPLVGSINEGLRNWRFNIPALQAIQAMLDEAQAYRDVDLNDASSARLPFHDAIALHNVDLVYDERRGGVLNRFNLTIAKSQITAITGPSGSGKSSIADLVCGLLVPDGGEVRIDGQALDAQTRIRWRRQTAYVEQAPYLLDSTIAENLRWGRPDASDDALWAALETASAGFVRDLPEQLATPVGEAGRQLSGGEKQRIALARALLSDPDLLILDEISAALDHANTAAIIASIERLRGSCAVLILTHDPLLIEIADHAVSLDQPPSKPGEEGA